jgi:hypothetical protein
MTYEIHTEKLLFFSPILPYPVIASIVGDAVFWKGLDAH